MSSMNRGTTPLDRLRSRFDRESRVCGACGFEDEDCVWTAETSGSRVRYSHVCPSCGSESRREYRLK